MTADGQSIRSYERSAEFDGENDEAIIELVGRHAAQVGLYDAGDGIRTIRFQLNSGWPLEVFPGDTVTVRADGVCTSGHKGNNPTRG